MPALGHDTWAARMVEAGKPVGDRHQVKWQKPEVVPGRATQLHRVTIPHSALRETRVAENLSKVVWLNDVGNDTASYIDLYETPASLIEPDTSTSPYQPFANLSLRSGGHVVLFHHVESMTIDQKSLLILHRAAALQQAESQGYVPKPERRMSMTAIANDSGVFIEYELCLL